MVDYRNAVLFGLRHGMVLHLPSNDSNLVKGTHTNNMATLMYLGLIGSNEDAPLSAIPISPSNDPFKTVRIACQSASKLAKQTLHFQIKMKPRDYDGRAKFAEQYLNASALACTRPWMLQQFLVAQGGSWPWADSPYQRHSDGRDVHIAVHHRRGDIVHKGHPDTMRAISDALTSNLVNHITMTLRTVWGEDIRVCVHLYHEESKENLLDLDKSPSKLNFSTKCVKYHGMDLLGTFKGLIFADVVVGGGSSLFWTVMSYTRAINVVTMNGVCMDTRWTCGKYVPGSTPFQTLVRINEQVPWPYNPNHGSLYHIDLNELASLAHCQRQLANLTLRLGSA